MFNLQSIVLLVISYFVIPRLTFLPTTLHSLLIVFGPFLLPRLINVFNSARAASRSVPIRPTPPKVQHALNLLAASAAVCLVLTLPYFAPENVFLKTQSRLQIEPSVLFARLRLLRDLTPADETLRIKFGSIQNRLVYLAYGPDTLLNCIWCSSGAGNDAQNYLLYSLPKLVTPHIFHLAVLGLATSSFVGTEGSRFRIHATIAGLVLLVAEAWYLGTYDISGNKKARMLQEIDFAHWRVRLLRYLSFAAVDAALGLVLWLTSTNRWLARPASIAERLEMTTRDAEQSLSKLHALGLLSNSINRDQTLRNAREAYWRMEGEEMAEVVQEEDVTAEINKALSKMDVPNVQRQIDQAVDALISDIDGLGSSLHMSASAAAGEQYQ
ncbi:uncharacterized protein EI97DRAFT_457287 [Westerdykella ornata]|uniref:Uncharacterized protein n=1 Tax=Westerdykella ornata TaxID=318751 RepID=A0A6A6JPJ2_WESOR|nr:uncharacterized protein EI97DRAFT_457287 [Westerdykella ornata]KAF2278063.1 hypothetical protein EI97DRAFT_457287 [Westerdykella ornata]